MQVFVVLNLSRPVEVSAAIQRVFPADNLALREGQWLVAGNLLTTRDVCDRLDITNGQNGTAVVVAMDAFWGIAPGNIWEWITTRKAANGG